MDTAALQSAIDTAPPGGVVTIPQGRHRLAKGLNITKPLVLRGEGIVESDNTSPFGSREFADDHESGTVLECEATEGYAIDVQGPKPVYLENFCLKGVGDKGRTTRGIRIGQEGVRGPNSSRLRELVVSNFAVGCEIWDSYYGRYDCLSIYGCTTGLLMANNQTICTQLNIAGCNVGVHLVGGQLCLFYGGAIQGVYGTGVLIEKGEEHLFEGFYFENKDAKFAFDIRSDINRLVWNHLGTFGDAVRISGNGNTIFSATRAISNVEIRGQDTTFLGPIAATLTDTGARTRLLPPMGSHANPPIPAPPQPDTIRAKDLILSGSIDFGDGRKWTPQGLFMDPESYWTPDGLYPGPNRGIKWKGSGTLIPGANESFRFVGWEERPIGSGNRRSGFVVPPLKGNK